MATWKLNIAHVYISGLEVPNLQAQNQSCCMRRIELQSQFASISREIMLLSLVKVFGLPQGIQRIFPPLYSNIKICFRHKGKGKSYRQPFDKQLVEISRVLTLVRVSALPQHAHIRPQRFRLLLLLYYSGEWVSCAGIPAFLNLVFRNL